MSLLWATLQTQWIYDGVCVTQALLWLWVRGWKSPEALITTFCNMRILTFTHLISSFIISQSHVSNQSGLGLINRTRPLPRTWDRPNICIQYYGKGNTQKKNFFFFKLLCVCRSLFFFSLLPFSLFFFFPFLFLSYDWKTCSTNKQNHNNEHWFCSSYWWYVHENNVRK